MTFGSDDVGCNPEALLTLPNRGRSRFGCWRLRRLLETGLEMPDANAFMDGSSLDGDGIVRVYLKDRKGACVCKL